MLHGAAVKGVGGKKGRSGRKSKAEELGVQEWFDKNLPDSARVAIVKNLVRIAKGQDDKAAVSAATMLFSYTFGKPKERVEHSNPDGSALLAPVAEAMVKVYGRK